MKIQSRLRVAGLIAVWGIAGCASFEPALHTSDLLRARQPSVVETREGLEISVEEFASPHKSLQAFDADVAANGVLALLVRAENKGSGNYKIEYGSITTSLAGQALPVIGGMDAANQAATSEYAGKALGWTLATGPFAILLWPATISGSAAHTQSVNRRIQQHFETLRFNDALLKPNQTAAGFVYFKLPDNSQKLDSVKVTAQATEESSGKRLSFAFSFPEIALK